MIRKTSSGSAVSMAVFALVAFCFAGGVSAQEQGQMPEEIEVAPGVFVPCDLWEDDYVPTAGDLTDAGFLESDAQTIAQRQCTWAQIKACFMGFHNPCCPKKADG